MHTITGKVSLYTIISIVLLSILALCITILLGSIIMFIVNVMTEPSDTIDKDWTLCLVDDSEACGMFGDCLGQYCEDYHIDSEVCGMFGDDLRQGCKVDRIDDNQFEESVQKTNSTANQMRDDVIGVVNSQYDKLTSGNDGFSCFMSSP